MHVDVPAAAIVEVPTRWHRVLLPIVVLALTIAAGGAMRTVFSPVQELAKADLGFSDFEISLVQGLAASIPIAVLSIPIGRMVDRRNRKRILVALALAWTAGSLMTVQAHAFPVLFVARMLAGVGSMCAIPVAISIAADLAPPALRGRSLLLLSLGNMAGGAAAFALGGWVLGALTAPGAAALVPGLAPWRGVHLVFAIASTALLLPLLLLREPARREVAAGIDIPLRVALREILERRRLLAPLFLGQVTVVMADTAATIWAAPVLMRDYGLQPAAFAGWMGLVVLASGIVGSVVGAFAADLGHQRRARGGILVGAVVAATLSIPGALFPVAPTVTGFALLLALFLTCGAITGLVTATAIAVLVPNEIRGVCLGAFIVIGAIVGLGIAPTLVTVISDALGGEAFIRRALAATTVATSVVAAVGFVAAARTLRRA